MLSAKTPLKGLDLPHAAGHVRAALEAAGFEDIFLTKTKERFRARAIRGRTPLAMLTA